MTEPLTHERAAASGAREREIAQLSLSFVLDTASRGIAGLKSLDSVLMMAINQANIAPLTRDPSARSRYGGLDAPAPDEERRPVSVRAVAASLRLPYETARRNIRRLEELGVCVCSEAGVVVPEAFMRSNVYFEAARTAHDRLYALYSALGARGLLEPLPASNYDEDEPPIRAAVRLLSDYLLRTAELVMARAGDLPSGLVVLPLLAAAAGRDARPLSVAALTRRLQMPAETVRRHAHALAQAGVFEAGRGGLVMPQAVVDAPAWASLLRENAVNTQRMFAGLAERGLVEVWERMAVGANPALAKGAA